jgi:translocation and assembly module TamB
MRIGDGRVIVEDGVLAVGEGRIAFSGDLGAARTAQARFDALPLGILNPFLGDLAASGTLSGILSASGSAAAPAINFDLQARDVSFALLELVGIEPLAAEAEGHYEGGTLTVDAAATVEGRLVTLHGDIGDKLDVTLGADAVPLALLDGVAPQLGLGGTVSAELHATGSLSTPEASFNVTGSDLTAAPLRAVGVPGLGLEAAGEFRGNSVALSQAVVSVGDGRIAFSGMAGETLDLAYDISGLPLSLATALRLASDWRAGLWHRHSQGAVLDPRVTFDVQGREIATAQLRQAGLPVVGLDAEGIFAEGVAALDRVVATIGEGRIELAGTAGTELDLNATLADISLALAGAFLPVALEGELSGSAEIRGFLLDPVASFDLEAPALTTPVLRAEGMPTMALAVQGNYASGERHAGGGRANGRRGAHSRHRRARGRN